MNRRFTPPGSAGRAPDAPPHAGIDDTPIPGEADLPGLYRRPPMGSSEQVSRAVACLEGMIIEGRLAPGQRLIEADITAELGVARGRVREALRILAGDGKIELIPNRGARVSTLSRTSLASMMEALAAILLAGVEAFGDRHGAPSPPVAAAIEAAMARIAAAAAAGDAAAMLVRQTEFHVLINHLSGNEYLNIVVSRMNIALYERGVAQAMSPEYMAAAVAAFERATSLVVAGKARQAARILRTLVAEFIEYLRS